MTTFAGFENLWIKNCFYCGSKRVIKKGKNKGRQLYLCKDCRKQFLQIKRINSNILYHEYVHGKQMLEQLFVSYQISCRTVQRKLSESHPQRIISSQKRVVVLMDTTYWERHFGVVVFKIIGQNGYYGENLSNMKCWQINKKVFCG